MSPTEQRRATEKVVLLTRVVAEVVKKASQSCEGIAQYGKRLDALLAKKDGAEQPQRG